MEKSVVLQALISQLGKRVETSRNASLDAASYATDEESRAESKWDTQGLEASYLAAGQASQSRETAKALQRLLADRDALLKPISTVGVGALLCVDFGGGETETYFIAPVGGGEVIHEADESVTVLTPQSPLFTTLQGKVSGTEVILANGNPVKVLSVA
jgi:hypothetical protein